MDGKNFDELTRSLATSRSRRSVLRGLIGGGAALVAMRAGSSQAASKVLICHYPPGNPGNVHVISVSANAVAAHVANHGDTVLGTVESCTDCGDVCTAVDACTPAECTADGCNTASVCTDVDTCTPAACVDGACNTTSACTDVDTCTPAACVDGACNAKSACTAVDTCTPAACVDGSCNQVTSCQDVDTCTPAACVDGSCNQVTSCQDVDTCTPAACVDGSCNQVTSCQDVDTCTPAACVDGSCNAKSACIDVDACTPAECTDHGCNKTSSCKAVDACTPAECTDNGCNTVSACVSPNTCGGGGTINQCGCTSDCSGATCADLSNGCGGTCPVADQGTRSVTVSYSAGSNPDWCNVQFSLSGFAGCHQFAGTYTAKEGPQHDHLFPSPGCGPTGTTGMDGTVVQGSCSYVKNSKSSFGGSCVEIVIDGVSSGCPPVDC